jgi:hypothetical protein
MRRGLADRPTELGFDADHVDRVRSTEGDRLDVIVPRISDFEFGIPGESDPTLRERVLGTVRSTLTEKTDEPQLTIRTSV